jgi:hypothetical protein
VVTTYQLGMDFSSLFCYGHMILLSWSMFYWCYSKLLMVSRMQIFLLHDTCVEINITYLSAGKTSTDEST